MARDHPPNKKRRISSHHNAPNASAADPSNPIANSRDLQEAMSYDGAGIKRVRDFLNCCSTGPQNPDLDETEVTRNRAILREYLEAQTKKRRGNVDEAEEEGEEAFKDVAQMWAYAFQNNSQHVMTMIPATLVILVRICSHNEDFRVYGVTLIKSILQYANLKIIYRCLTGLKEHHKSPCLRLLTEMNRFDFGSMCATVHTEFDFTIKDLVKNFDGSKAGKGEPEDPTRPSVRTLAVRFYLSFLQNAEPSIRTEVLGLRTWVNAIFKYIKTDTPAVVAEVLETLSKNVLQDKEIVRPIKTTFFNEHVLGHILSLYSRDEDVKISRAGKEEDRTVGNLAHEFLLQACTTRSNGICFPDQGWYPPGYAESEGKRRGAHKVFNRTLASLSTSVRPYADELQLDLLLAIFKAAPELVAEYFTANVVFGFDPKLTTTWIGYCTFLTAAVALPVPENLSASASLTIPPPVEVVMENIIPKPLTKPIMTKCLAHEVSLIRFLSIRLLITAFQKLQTILKTLDEISESIHDPQGNWLKFRMSVVEEFCKRIPDVNACSGSLGTSKAASAGLMQGEAQARLLAEYYTTVPELALAGKLDLNTALTAALEAEESDPAKRGVRLLELGHLLRVANELSDTRWWNKTPSMKNSPFVSILKHCCTTKTPSQQVQSLLHSFAASSQLFQTETIVSPIDALLDSLSSTTSGTTIDAILTFLDEVIARCIRQPFKYLDDFTELAVAQMERSGSGPMMVKPISPVLMTLVEQWKFFAASKEVKEESKLGAALWVNRFLERCVGLGENEKVMAVLFERLASDSAERGLKKVFEAGKKMVIGEMQIQSRGGDVADTGMEIGVRTVTEKGIVLNTSVLHHRLEQLQTIGSEPSLFELAISIRDAQDIVRAGNDILKPLTQACEIIKVRVLQLLGRGDETAVKAKKLVAGEATKWPRLLANWEGSPAIKCDIFNSFMDILVTCFDEDDELYLPAKKDMLDLVLDMVHATPGLSDDKVAKVSASFNAICLLGLEPADYDHLITRLSSAQDHTISTHLLSFLLRRAVHTSITISVTVLNTLLQTQEFTASVAESLATYIAHISASDLEGIEYSPACHDYSHATIECAFIRKLPAFRAAGLVAYTHQLKKNEISAIPDGFFAALVEAYCDHDEETDKYTWCSDADADVQDDLSKILRIIWPQLLEKPLDVAQIELFIRVASVIDVVDKNALLAHIAKDRKRGNLSDRLIGLLDVVLDDDDEIEATGMKGWFLMVFDYLTRRFAEDQSLTPKAVTFAKTLGRLLVKKEISLEKVVPRITLNAIVEAALEKHIGVQEIIEFVVTLITLTPSSNFDIAKFLQTILTHTNNPLHTRSTASPPEPIHHTVVYLLHLLYTLGKPSSVANLTTLDGILLLYRGLSDSVDSLLFSILVHIESHLSRSVAGRISAWSVAEQAEQTPLVSQFRGKLAVTVNGKVLMKSIYNMPLRSILTTPMDMGEMTLEKFLEEAKRDAEDAMTGGGEAGVNGNGKIAVYDPRFMLPILMHMLMDENAGAGMDVMQAVEKGCVGYAMMAIANREEIVRMMAVAYLSAVVSKIQSSTIRPKTQLVHHLSSLLASLETTLSSSSTVPPPPPTLPLLYLATTLPILLTPHHYLYSHHISLLLSTPIVPLDDIPFPITLIVPDSESPHRHILFTLTLLAGGIRTKEDVELYRRRNVIPTILELYSSPNMISPNNRSSAINGPRPSQKGGLGRESRIKEKILELLWNFAGVEGGATTLTTRYGVLAWIEGAVAGEVDAEKKIRLRRLEGRVWEGGDKGYVMEWSKGVMGRWVKDGLAKEEEVKRQEEKEEEDGEEGEEAVQVDV
ncbi:hypothetical protein EX30DRAFT_339263 [Ascodesmis nigricans]|uniref:Nucleolar pre-ribosomal-associated protein 1 C-terminal domain-containing protein n=1 Tax=Ascodesmis nigricans TaxID=341454 RepID=A0A4S2N1X9_9PEZI|nr:hypothetical protein EX30DRAFT_339263 [Ascodesmis nigricans]